ncbi:UNVERIFIED_CONTAM: hypothetical protein FKN15_049196 [Acipenser sinensis]
MGCILRGWVEGSLLDEDLNVKPGVYRVRNVPFNPACLSESTQVCGCVSICSCNARCGQCLSLNRELACVCDAEGSCAVLCGDRQPGHWGRDMLCCVETDSLDAGGGTRCAVWRQAAWTLGEGHAVLCGDRQPGRWGRDTLCCVETGSLTEEVYWSDQKALRKGIQNASYTRSTKQNRKLDKNVNPVAMATPRLKAALQRLFIVQTRFKAFLLERSILHRG